ncbi:2814_t:CDS:2 [Scutellospora calospora]|uniref:2814_t:CDS:1 n=1 Tax=Scutellospora calospora TaxID=85575 RepID=A0ACA9MAT0_9GLOM|nr:2814_t:CDS:2 [Scutellospora calospora]
MLNSDKKNQRTAIAHLWTQGIYNAMEIHRWTNAPLSTIYDNLKKLKTKGTMDHAKGNGRPKKITKRAAQALGQYIHKNPSISTRTMVNKLEKTGVKVSHSTISRHLADAGYTNSLPQKTPMLTVKHKLARVKWAEKHLEDNWNRTFFTDETAFQLFRNTLKYWYKGSRPVRRIPKDRTKLKAWGGFWVKGKSSLYCFKGIMNAEFYVNIIKKHLPEQQDNDSKHTSRLATAFIKKNVPVLLDWPSNSPDINPIENLWSVVKQNVEKRMPKDLSELERYMIEEWNKIPNSFLANLVGSMRRRCELLIEKDGEHISY